MSVRRQFLLQRRAGSTPEEFRESYLRHARLVLPWCIANRVRYYAQIHKPAWASASAEAKYPDVDLSQWDSAAEMVFSDEEFGKVGKRYYETVILVDETRFLRSAALDHTQRLEPGSVDGQRYEFIRDGTPLVDFEEWQRLWDEVEEAGEKHEGKAEAPPK